MIRLRSAKSGQHSNVCFCVRYYLSSAPHIVVFRVCFHLWHNQLKGSHALRCSVPSVFLQCSCWPAGTKVRGSNPEGKWKAYKHSCFATSLKCAGNPQEIMVCSRWGAVFLWWDFAGCATDAECCRAFQQANDTMWVFTLRSFYNNTICAMVCLCV